MAQLSGMLPILPLRNTVIFPGVTQLISVGRPRSVAALKTAQENQKNNPSDGPWIFAVSQKNTPTKDELTAEDLFEVGTLCKIESVRGGGEQGYQVLVRGVYRMRISGVQILQHGSEKYFSGLGEQLADLANTDEGTLKALLQSVKKLSKEILQLIPANTEQIREMVDGVQDLPYLIGLSATHIEMPVTVKQEILSEVRVKERTMRLLQVMQELKDNLVIQQEIRGKLSNKLGEAHRQNILREQMRTIREELGEGDDAQLAQQLADKIEKAEMPEDAKKLALQELKRLEQISQQSPEFAIIRNYLDLMTDLPWNRSAPEINLDLDKAREILDRDHFGLEKVKKRIIQHLAVMKLKGTTKGTILLFLGPPGVGKTSLGQSIAEALGRKFTRISLGGVRDDAEVRGHRRTYVGAMPGRIIASLKRIGQNNPVMLFDEIDKMSRSFNGDPAAAMLEILDPEQNKNFVDHYLDTGFDLSNIIFIATANSLEGIPAPLLDRLEVIEVSSYTSSEKLQIAIRHLLPKELVDHGMTAEQLLLTESALARMISGYTRESGVRELRRKIAEVCRHSGEAVLAAAGTSQVIVDADNIETILGPERFQLEVAAKSAGPGVVTGLAWTPMGGDILFIETTLMPGTGGLTMTGQLGDVMKESAQIALSLLRSRLTVLAPEVDFKKFDVHVHVPSGAIPKDGPSAGVAMLTSLASAFTGRLVDPHIAMTGEITLRGAVTPVGGIKEKVIAAHRAGIQQILLPARNQKDLREVPEEVRSQIQFHFIEHVNEILKHALQMSGNLLQTEYPVAIPKADSALHTN